MKRIIKTTILISLFVMTFSSILTTNNVLAQDEHDAHSGSDCTDSTETLMIDTHASNIAFDKTELKATKGACVMFMFKNTQTVEHDFTIIRTNGSEWAHLHLENNFDNETGPSPGVRMVRLQMPDENVTFKFVCTVTGHEAAGMAGNLIVGEGSPSDDDSLPGFGLYSAFAGLITLMVLIPKLKRKN